MSTEKETRLTQSDVRRALDELQVQQTRHEFELQLLEAKFVGSPQRKLGQALIPVGSWRERLFLSVLAKLRKRTGEQGASTNPPTGDLGLVKRVLGEAESALPALEQYRLSLANSQLGAANPGPCYVKEADPAGDQAAGDVRLIAFYLPQFHPIPENDSEWGRGFTEWTNVTRAVPQYLGQYQPHLPEDPGFYDLRISENQERQVDLARKYGITGFAFYYYWFGGRRLLEKPLDQFVSNPKIEFPFCLIWANENWTRRWDGHEDDVFVAQVHTPEADVQFIHDARKYLEHPNYIRVGGKPLLIVYKTQLLPEAAETAQRWRDYAKEIGLGDLYLVAAQTMGFTDPTPVGFDAAMQFPPHNEHMDAQFRLKYWAGVGPEVLNPEFQGSIYSYPGIVRSKLDNPEPKPYTLLETAFPMWDNTARRPTSGWIYAYSNPALYRLWLSALVRRARKRPDPSERLVFLNAWNEWAEGAHLEPDRRHGYAYLDATQQAKGGECDPRIESADDFLRRLDEWIPGADERIRAGDLLVDEVHEVFRRFAAADADLAVPLDCGDPALELRKQLFLSKMFVP